MSAAAFHAIATQFSARYLHPLQFRRGNTVEDRVGALENARQKQGTPEVPAHGPLGQENTPAAAQQHLHTEVQRVGEDHRSDLDAWHAKHSGAASDLLHTFNSRMNNVQAQTQPSGGAWDDFHAAFGTHASTSVQSAPQTPPPAAKPQRFEQHGLFGPSQVASTQQFGLAAAPGPRPKAGQVPAAKQARRSPELSLFSIAATRRANTPGYVADQDTKPSRRK
jgi:hypothetical protein